MRTDISRRISALESSAGLGEDRIDVIIRTLVRPGASGPENGPLKAVVNRDKSWRLDREQNESREDFLRRAFELVPRPAHGVACLREMLDEQESIV